MYDLFYRSTITGKLVHSSRLQVLCDIYGTSPCQDHVLVPVINPSVIDCLQSASEVEAIFRYMHIHECSAMEARKMVEIIKSDLKKYQMERRLTDGVQQKEKA